MNTTFLLFWLMLMKPPHPETRFEKRLRIDPADPITLGKTKARDVEPAAVNEVELIGVIESSR